MTGWIDGNGLAWVRINVQNPWTGVAVPVDACVDTAFSGDLALLLTHVHALGLQPSQQIMITRADGSQISMDTYTCLLPWFGSVRQIEAIGKPGGNALIGVGLLQQHELIINYPARTLTLT